MVRGEGAVFHEGEEVAEFLRGDGAIGNGEGLLVEGAEEVVDEEVRGFLRGDGGVVGGFEILREMAVGGEDGGVVGSEAEVVFVTADFSQTRLGDEGSDGFQQRRGGDGKEIRAREVAVVVGVLLGAHELGFAEVVVPAAGGLDLGDAHAEFLGLAGDLEMDRAADGGEGVEVFQLHLRAEGVGFLFAEGDVHVAAEVALFHVGVGGSAFEEDELERAEVGDGLLGGLEIRLADDLHERGAGAVEIDERGGGEVGGFRDVLLKVDAVEADDLVRGLDVFPRVGGVAIVEERDAAAEAEGKIHLGGLVVFRHVRVEIILPVPAGELRRAAAEGEAGEEGFLDGEFVQDRERAGVAEADGAGVRVRVVAEGGAAGAEHLGVGVDLGVDF